MPKGGQAEKAGVKAGMEVVGVDGKDVANWFQFRTELRVSPRAENPRKAGDKVTSPSARGRRSSMPRSRWR